MSRSTTSGEKGLHEALERREQETRGDGGALRHIYINVGCRRLFRRLLSRRADQRGRADGCRSTQPGAAPNVVGSWSYSAVLLSVRGSFCSLADALLISFHSLEDYIAVKPKYAVYVPHTAGRYQTKRFRKAQCPIVERLTNSLMMHGRNNAKKQLAVRIVRHALEIVHLLSDQNPVQARSCGNNWGGCSQEHLPGRSRLRLRSGVSAIIDCLQCVCLRFVFCFAGPR